MFQAQSNAKTYKFIVESSAWLESDVDEGQVVGDEMRQTVWDQLVDGLECQAWKLGFH